MRRFLNVMNFAIVISCLDIMFLVITERDVRIDPGLSCTSGLLKNLPASSFFASSVLNNDPQFGPEASKVDSIYKLSVTTKAWCPNHIVSNDSSEWLQVDFLSMKIIKTIFTLGRDAGNYGEYVAGYYFDYQREDGLTWYRYRNNDHVEIMKGNDDIRNPTHQNFISPLIAKRIRIIPISTTPRRVCLKFTLYGCDFNDGVVEYQMPKGNTLSYRSKLLSLDDNVYDGVMFSNKTWLQGGMGKIMDNIVPGNESNQIDINKFFVAWDQNFQKKDYIEIFFKFETGRILESVLLYTVNIPSLMILPFSSVIIEVSNYESKATPLKIFQQNFNGDQPVMILLQNKEARLVKVTIAFKSRWMGLAEVVFNSSKINTEQIVKVTYSWNDNKPYDNISPNTYTEKVNTEYTSKLIIPVTLISCFIGALIAVIIIIFICFFWIRQRKRRKYKSKLCDYRSMIVNDPTYPSNVGNINTISGKSSLLCGPADSHIFGPNSISTIGFRYIHPPFPDYQPHSSSNSNEYEHIDSYWPKVSIPSDSFIKNSTTDKLERQKMLVSGVSDITNISGCGPVYCSSSTYSSHPYDANIPGSDIIPLTSVTQDTFADMFNIHITHPLKGLLGTSISCCKLSHMSQTWIETALSRLCETGPVNVFAQKHVSEGEIGYITSGIVDNCEHGVIVADLKRNKVNVELKYSFYKQCFATIKQDFSSHGNLLPIIGKYTYDDLCPSILYGYPSQVNVVSFFHKLRKLPMSNDVSFSCSYVSQGSLLYLMKQLVNALAFLDEAGVVHRDISARNCSIGDCFHLILLDFAIGLDEFQDDYISFSAPQCSTLNDTKTRPTLVQLPLLWMPWEAIFLGNFTSKSDVWSFGVTLWEIFTECQLKPYSVSFENSSRDPSIILKNSLLIANNHPSGVLPNGRTIDQTSVVQEKCIQSDISKNVRDIMHLCWQSNPVLRPNFRTLFSIISELSPDLRYVDEYGTLHRMIS